MRTLRVLFTGSGGGGHIFPVIAVATELRHIAEEKGIKNLGLFYLGPRIEEQFTRELMQEAGIEIHTLLAGKLRRYFSLLNILDIFKIPVGIIQALYLLLKIMPDVILSKGAYGSVPVVLAGWLYRIPIIIHESDAIPGLANRKLARFASRIGAGFARAMQYFPEGNAIVTGNPVRKSLLLGSREVGREFFNISSERPVLLVIGGSQGAETINDAILTALPTLLVKYEIIHITGEKNYKQVTKEAAVVIPKNHERLYHPYPSLKDELAHAYAIVSIVISRSGATSIFEIALIGKPSILIPLKTSAGNHQRENAYVFKDAGACAVIEEDNLTTNILMSTIDQIVESKNTYGEFSRNAKQFSLPDAAKTLARELYRVSSK